MTDPGVQEVRDSLQTSTALLASVRAMEPEAWRRFVRLYAPLVYYWCRRAGLQPADAQDVGQEVFRAVARKIGDFRRDRPGDSFRGWLRRMVTRKVADRSRRRPPGATGAGGSDAVARLARVAVREPADPPDEPGERRLLLRRALDLTLGHFHERTRAAFLEVVGHGRAPAEVARELGVSVNAVYVAKGRVLARLRADFATLIDL